MTVLNEMIKIADIHAARISMALKKLEPMLPFDAHKINEITEEQLLLTELLEHRFGRLQDLMGGKIIDSFLESLDEYSQTLSMLDKIYKLEKLEIIEDAELWKDMRKVRSHLLHEYPNHPEFTAESFNRIIHLAPHLLKILSNIKRRMVQQV